MAVIVGSKSYAEPSDFRIERHTVSGGSELLTIFGKQPSAGPDSKEIPLLSVLRDTLGDSNPENDRLRYVWVLTSTRPDLLQRAAAALPFFYFRTDVFKHADRRPAPVLDLSHTYRGVIGTVAGSSAQLLALDPTGAVIRSSTRSYRNNLSDHGRLHLLEGVAVLSQLENVPDATTVFTESELLEMETRLTLAGKMLGGLVSPDKLPSAYMKQRAQDEEIRAHNWELLRQRAEDTGLYFEPFGIDGTSTQALLWIDAADVSDRKLDKKWSGDLLGIANPFRDPRLKNWTGYREVRDGREMIPLALYALDYPKVPLLLADFRDTTLAKRREMIRHAATDTVSGVLGISRFSNLPFLAGSMTYNFISERHGAANNRDARLKAYSQVRAWLALDQSINPGLRIELQKRLEVMGVNPAEESIFTEARIAERQYAALLKYADDPKGLPARVERDRQGELTADLHSPRARTGFFLAKVATFGAYTHRDKIDEPLEARLDKERRMARQIQFLETVAKSGPQAEIVWNMDEVRRAVDEIASLGTSERSAKLVRKILVQTHDEQTRASCERALRSLDVAALEY